MALVVPDGAEKIILDLLRNLTNFNAAVIKLYKNNYTPIDTTVHADFTEANYTGYVAQTLGSGVAATTVSGKAYVPYTQRTFQVTSSPTVTNLIYGYWIYSSASGSMLWAERFTSAPISMVLAGDTIKLTPTLTLFSEF